jgi:hypothetical protein
MNTINTTIHDLVRHVSTCIGHIQFTVKCNEIDNILLCLKSAVTDMKYTGRNMPYWEIIFCYNYVYV